MYLYDLGKGVSRYVAHGFDKEQLCYGRAHCSLAFLHSSQEVKKPARPAVSPAGISIRRSLEARRTENYHSRLTLDIIRYLINSLYNNIISYNISIDTILSGDPSDPGDPAYIVDIYKPTSPQPTGAKPLGSGILPKMNST